MSENDNDVRARILSDEETLQVIAELEALNPEPESFDYRLLQMIKENVSPPELPPLGIHVSDKVVAKEKLGGG